jgi:hypothetical protein
MRLGVKILDLLHFSLLHLLAARSGSSFFKTYFRLYPCLFGEGEEEQSLSNPLSPLILFFRGVLISQSIVRPQFFLIFLLIPYNFFLILPNSSPTPINTLNGRNSASIML